MFKVYNLSQKIIQKIATCLLYEKKLFQLKPSEGFKMAVQHHLDQPLMQINEIDISPGFETQVKMTIYNINRYWI